MTITRVIYEIQMVCLTAGSGGIMAYGMGMFNDDAVASLALPDPQSDTDEFSWYTWAAQLGVFTSTVNDSSQARIFRGDLHGQRKLPSEEHDFGLILARVDGVAVNINIDGWVRTLCKRP